MGNFYFISQFHITVVNTDKEIDIIIITFDEDNREKKLATSQK